MERRFIVVLMLLMCGSLMASPMDSLPEKPRKFLRRDLSGIPRYYYFGRDYGSESLYNPVTLILNAGYDILQLSNNDNRMFNYPYGTSIKNTFENLGRPDRAIGDIGAWKWVRTEVLPLTWNREGAQWLPNYLLHGLGGGMTYVAMSEWYDHHKVPYPRLMGAITYITGQMMNEIMETQGWTGTNADAIADVYIFNFAGILLFTVPSVNRFFSGTLHMADWSYQPTITVPYGSLQNNGQYFALKYAMPFHKPLRLFLRMGMSNMGGLSYKFGKKGYSISAAAGIRSHELELLDPAGRQVTISTALTAGVFLDKDNTVMASLVWANVRDYFMQANVYPGVLRLGKFSPGLWAIVGRDGYATFGITSKYTFGVGIGGEVNAPY